MPIAIVAICALILVMTAGPLAAFAKTTKGANPYTVKGAVNVLAYYGYWQRCALIINATVTSGFRSEAVNAAVGGVANSDHLAGLACDFAPIGEYWAAVAKAKAACARGELGPVRQFIAESYKNCLHLGMYAPGKTGPTEYLEQTDAATCAPLTKV